MNLYHVVFQYKPDDMDVIYDYKTKTEARELRRKLMADDPKNADNYKVIKATRS